MKSFKYLWIALLTICMVACGDKEKSGDKSEIRVKPLETEVSGDMEGCFVVVDKEYKATGDWGDGLITVEIERTEEDLPFDLEGQNLYSFSEFSASEYIQVGFGIEFYDEEGNVLKKISADGSGFSGSYSPDEAKALVKLKPGKKGTIRFQAKKGAVGFKISSAYEEHGGGGKSHSFLDDDEKDDDDDDNDDDDEIANVKSVGADLSKPYGDKDLSDYLDSSEDLDFDVDEWLDGYEKLLDEAIRYIDGYRRGDPTAVEKYNHILQESLKYSKTGSKVGHYFVRSGNPVQKRKFQRIMEKAQKLTQNAYK